MFFKNYQPLPRDPTHDPATLLTAIKVLLGSAILWFLLQYLEDTNPIWAIISMIIVTETHIRSTWLNFQARLMHTLIGCLIGLLFLLLFRGENWNLPVALCATVLISNYWVRIPLGWRVAPITTALIVSAGASNPSLESSLHLALHRTGEVLLGSAMALVMTWLTSLIWKNHTAHLVTDHQTNG